MARVRETIADRVEREGVPWAAIEPVKLMERGAVTIEGAVKEYGLGASTWRSLTAMGLLPIVRGEVKRLLIPRVAIDLYLAQRLAFRTNLVVLPIQPAAATRGRDSNLA